MGGGLEKVQDGALLEWGREAFILFSCDRGGEEVFVDFPKGRGLHGGWSVLCGEASFSRSRSLVEIRGVVSPIETRSNPKEGTVIGTFVDAFRKDLTMVGEAIWLQRGESEMKCRDEQLRWCLVGWFVEVSDPLLNLISLKSLVTNVWSLKGGVENLSLGGSPAFV